MLHILETLTGSWRGPKGISLLVKRRKRHGSGHVPAEGTCAKFMHWKESLGQSVSSDKKEEWKSETQMLEQFGEYELQLHMDSGSVEYAENPWTAGVWHYRDKGDLVKRTKVT